MSTDGWEIVTKNPFAANDTGPELTIYVDGTGRINAAADREIGKPAAIQFLANPSEMLVGLQPAEENTELDTYTVTRSDDDGAGGDIRPKQALKHLGVDLDAIDETTKLPLQSEPDKLVADCSTLPQNDTAADTRTGDRAPDTTSSAADDDSDEDEGQDECECRHCSDTFDSEQGRNIHEGRVHKGEDDEDDENDVDDEAEVEEAEGDEEDELTPDDVELPGSITEGDVHAVADFLDSVADVADDLEVNEERTERILRAYDCLDEVSDE